MPRKRAVKASHVRELQDIPVHPTWPWLHRAAHLLIQDTQENPDGNNSNSYVQLSHVRL